MLAALNGKTSTGTEEVFPVHSRVHRRQRLRGLNLRFNRTHHMLNFKQNFVFSKTTLIL